MKVRLFLVMFFILLLISMPATSETLSSQVILTAVKYQGGQSGAMPLEAYEIRMLNNSRIYLSDTINAELPASARNASANTIKAFTWVASGNRFSQVNLSFTIGPLVLKDSAYAIPYSLQFVCEETKIGNHTIPYDGTPFSTPSFKINNYTYAYSDHVSSIGSTSQQFDTLSWTLESDFTPAETNQTIEIKYDMSTNSTVSNNGALISNPSQKPVICNHWNRTGSAYVILGIKESNGNIVYSSSPQTAVPNGYYESTISVHIQAT